MTSVFDNYKKSLASHRATNARVKALLGVGTISRTTLKLRGIRVRPQRIPLYKNDRVVRICGRLYVDSPSGLRRMEPKVRRR